MSSLYKRLKKRAPLGQLRAKQLGLRRRERERLKQCRVFDAERRLLFSRLKAMAEEFGESDPVRFLVWLREQRRGYDPVHDGKSKAMALLGEIDELDERERQWDEKTRAAAPS